MPKITKISSRIIFYVLFIPLLLLVACKIADSQPKRKHSSFGNELSTYFYFTNTKVNQNLVNGAKLRIDEFDNLQLRHFYRKLNWKRNALLIDYKSDQNYTWNEINFDGSRKQNYLLYWKTIRPYMKDVYKKNLEDPKVAYPVVHFRCSDSPFNRCPGYNLTKASSVAWMAQQVKDRGFSKVIMLSCNMHRSLDQKNSCAKYTEFYASIFEKHGISVEIQCNSILKDFSMMFYSPILVSLNASSYSFMAGVAKDPQNFIACNMGLEIADKYYVQREADWIFDPRPPLLHKYVADYNDTDAVIRKLID